MPTPLGSWFYMDFKSFKQLVLEKAIEAKFGKDALIRLRTELFHAEVYYQDIGDLYEDLKTKEIKTEAAIIPLLLGFKSSYNPNIPLDFVQVRPGSSGGI